ncbi:extracellular solute-binding protein [Planococcus faecalis]|uniref:extracellular solute-binding protein n=1 Tax=Planococcus faecalis TaxID=1598147 RepID=UPI0008DA069F|nr:extracellular solute-binding protein [Planococcus faecalis]OHX51632.1 ABC transporter substrate-binding protein [Planococcus faecalis]
MKKMMILLFVLTMVFTAGCSNKAKETEDNGTKTIKVVYKDEGPSNPVAINYFTKLEELLKQEEDLDVKFELVEMPQGNYAEKLNLLLMSGEIPDLIYFQGGDQQIKEQDLLEDLTPYIEKSKYVKDTLQPQNIERMNNYPYLLWIKPLDSKTPVIRKDWFESTTSGKELLSNPTPENYRKFFKEIVENSPEENGKPTYAVTVAGDIAELDTIFNMAFGINKTWLEKDGKYINAKISEEEKEKLNFYSTLYKEGLLDPQYLTKQWDTKEEAFYDGSTAVIAGTNGKIIDVYNGKMKQVNGEGAEIMVLPPANGEYQGFTPTDITKESRGIAISSQSENKDTVFQILDFLASPEGQKFDRLGFEGEHYEETDSEIKLTEKYYNEWYSRFWESDEFQTEKPLETPLLSESAQKSRDLATEYYSQDNNFIIPEEYVSKWDAMENIYKEFATDVITGKRSIDDFDKFVEEWNNAGGNEITEYANKNVK